jgi:eukaryotic-like serine/threonine-protein kinase
MALTTRVWSAGKLLLLAGALVATYVLFAAASMRLALRASEVPVPDFTNRTANEASVDAAGLGLALRVDDVKRTDPKIAAGRILAQDPSPGATARRQRTVRVWVSSGPRSTTVPGVTGETERTAQLRLTQNGFPLSTVSEIRSQDFPADVVVAQEPPAKSPGASVSLLVNRSDRGATYVMPDLIGVNGDRAAEALRQRGFRMAVVGSNPYPGIPAGIVLRQSPQAGFQIAPGESVSLEVSR